MVHVYCSSHLFLFIKNLARYHPSYNDVHSFHSNVSKSSRLSCSFKENFNVEHNQELFKFHGALQPFFSFLK